MLNNGNGVRLSYLLQELREGTIRQRLRNLDRIHDPQQRYNKLCDFARIPEISCTEDDTRHSQVVHRGSKLHNSQLLNSPHLNNLRDCVEPFGSRYVNDTRKIR
ncbi:hypothetical protein KIN20_025021 [Parelaphostrongylus tenuis]|uniref:Uncharacterized protein n=1 Tax=Parelaphostrongylus tenuis TaxID=148309 RepID=A0AAD5QWM3_PARTN|nr:hypothetical protein KIN20_025021 [Parelaphostrongylus tenuis]